MALKNSLTMKVLALVAGGALLVAGGLFTIGAKTIKTGATSDEAKEINAPDEIDVLTGSDNFTRTARLSMVRNNGKENKSRVMSNNVYYVTDAATYSVYDFTMRSIDGSLKTTMSIKLREYIGDESYLYIDRFSYTLNGKSYIADRIMGQWIDVGESSSFFELKETFLYCIHDDDVFKVFCDFLKRGDFEEENDLYKLYKDDTESLVSDMMRIWGGGEMATEPTGSFEADFFTPASPTMYLEVKSKGTELNFSVKADIGFSNIGNTKITVPRNLAAMESDEFDNVFKSLVDKIDKDRTDFREGAAE